jgi:hypothetical protein
MRRSPSAAPTLLWLLLSALACTSGTRTGPKPGASAGTSAGAGTSASAGAGGSSGFDPSVTAGTAATPSASAGASGSEAGAGGVVADSAIANGPDDGGARPPDGGLDASPAPMDAASPTDAGRPPGCPLELPLFDDYCYREGLMCLYGMECCPDWAYCEFGRWTLLTHHCDACP